MPRKNLKTFVTATYDSCRFKHPGDLSLSLSGEDYSTSIWFKESWQEITEHLMMLEPCHVPMEFWCADQTAATMPRSINATLLRHPDTARLYDTFAVTLVSVFKIGSASVNLWTTSANRLLQNSFVVPLDPEWVTRPGSKDPPFIGEDHSFRTADGNVFLWHTIQDFISWATRKNYVS